MDLSILQDNPYVFADFVDRERGATDHRAWCTQEEFLSSRVLYFSNEVYWKCRCLYASEARSGGTRHPNFLPLQVHARNIQVEDVVKDYVQRDKMMTDWERVVEGYSQRQITMQNDRLVALAGMASAVGRSLGCEFVAGLWAGDQLACCRSLLWQVLDLQTDLQEGNSLSYDSDQAFFLRRGLSKNNAVDTRNNPMDKDIFPSWCWASCLSDQSRIVYNTWDEPMQADGKPSPIPLEMSDILEMDVDDIFTKGPLRGTLTINGRLRKMRVCEDQRHDGFPSDTARNIIRIIPFDEETDDSAKPSQSHPPLYSKDRRTQESPPPEESTFQYPIIEQSGPGYEWLDGINKNVNSKSHHWRDTEPEESAQVPTSSSSPSHAFQDIITARLQALENL
jgi:hypothetical protein